MTHQDVLAKMAPDLFAIAAALEATRLGLRVSTVSETRQRLGKLQHELLQLECAARFAGAMPEETRQAFEGVPA